MPRVVPDGDRLALLRKQLGLLSVAVSRPGKQLQYYLDAYGMDFSSDAPTVSYGAGFLPATHKQPGSRVFCQYWQQPEENRHRGTVFVLHGYYDHSGLYGHLIRFYLQQGFSVFAYDEPGHGLSDGAPASIDSFTTYTDILRRCFEWSLEHKLPTPFHLAGQSMGGAIITGLLAGERCSGHEYPVGKVMLFAPLVRPVLWRWGRVQYLLARLFLNSIPRSRSRNSHDQEFLNFLAAEPLQSKTLPVAWVGAMSRWIDKIEAVTSPCDVDVLLIQGQKDGTVDWRHNIPVLKRLYKSVDIFYLPEGKHHLVNESEQLRLRYMNWLRDKLR